MGKYRHVCLTAVHQPVLFITCLHVAFLLKPVFDPTGKLIFLLFCEKFSELILSHLNLSLQFTFNVHILLKSS